MLTIHNYHLHRKNDYYVAVNHETPLCPDCHSEMTVRDSYNAISQTEHA